jgi:thiol-disulfide isomerase/thioredoxin
MRLRAKLMSLLCVIAIHTYGQDTLSATLNIGDPAPSLRAHAWIKGEPVKDFEKGIVYVVEFWATWCKPCIAGMPHLSSLAAEFRDRTVILGVDVYEKRTTSLAKVKQFVDSMGTRMNYSVVVEDSDFMEIDWLNASGDKDKGIPITYVINGDGKLAWIGRPQELDTILSKIVNNAWDITEALARRTLRKRLEILDKNTYYDLVKYDPDPLKPNDLGKPDSILLAIDKLVKAEPLLKYMPSTAAATFFALLETNPHKAFAYGQEMLLASTYERPLNYIIYGSIDYHSKITNLPAEIYRLGADAYQSEINKYPEESNMPGIYHKMAAWYWRGHDKAKAIAAEQKAIRALKEKIAFSATDMAAFQSSLRHYKTK